MKANSISTLLVLFILTYFGQAIGGTSTTDDVKSTEAIESDEESVSMAGDALTGDIEAGEARYNKTCKNCHGSAGKGAASYPKISGNEISYTTSKLETYRAGTKIGPNSFLMIINAKPLTDEEIANLAAYLEVAKFP